MSAAMTTINEETYRNVASLLIERVGEADFFNGTVEYDTDEFYSSLHCTLIIRRNSFESELFPSVSATTICPVWWEYHLHQADGEQPNDFSWSEFTPYLEAATGVVAETF